MRRQLCLRSTYILQPQPPDCNTYLSVIASIFRCKPFIPRLKNPAKPAAGLHLVLCKARPGPLRVLPAVETRLAPERDFLVPALPRQIRTQSEQRQRQPNWRRPARESGRSLQYPAQLAMDQEECPDRIDYPIQYTKRPADSGRTGRNLNPRGDSNPSRGVTRSANPHAKEL